MEPVKRKDAIKSIFEVVLPNDVTASTTGLISREIFTKYDSARNIYVPGSMGLVSSIALAIAICHPEKRVIAIDGDASLLMNLGTIVTVSAYQPKNFLHIVLDNNAYGSCSEEKSLSSFAKFDKITKDVGYKYVRIVDSVVELKNAILNSFSGPSFILAKISLGGKRDFSRPTKLPEIKYRFMNFLKEQDKIKDK